MPHPNSYCVFDGDEQLQLVRDNAEKFWQATERETCMLVEAKLKRGAEKKLEDAGVKVFDHPGIIEFLGSEKPKPKRTRKNKSEEVSQEEQ